MDTQDSEEDFFFRGSRRYPNRGAGAFSSASRGDQHPSGSFSSYGRGAAQSGPPPRQPSQSAPPKPERRGQQWERSEQSQERGRREERSQRSHGDQSRHGADPPPNRDQRRSSGAGGGGGGHDSDSEDDPGYRPTIGAGRVAGSAGDLGAVRAAGDGETRRSEVAAQAEHHCHPRRLEAEAASEPVRSMMIPAYHTHAVRTSGLRWPERLTIYTLCMTGGQAGRLSLMMRQIGQG
jgi:hypothetical protein